jgi:hypothetical protein
MVNQMTKYPLTFNTCFATIFFAGAVMAGPADLSVTDHASIQEALDAHPGRMIFVPAGEYKITEKIRIRGERAGLFGPGRIVQQNADQPILEIEDAAGAEIRDLTLTRPAVSSETQREGILAIRCRDLVIDNVRVIDNRTSSGAMTLRECRDSRISRCLVRNYMRVTIDDRTGSKDWGYAFRCTDGTGISVSHSTGSLIEGNRVVEENLVPTPELKAKHKLGDFVKRNPHKGTIASQQSWDAGYTDNWQQGSGIIVTAPEVSDLTRILGNHIQNAAQGIDLHCDRVIVSQNIVANAFIGMKAMHGSRNVLISDNQFTRNSLWAIGLMPGAAAQAENADGGSIIANNIISDFGHGDAHWIWGDDRSPLKFDTGQQPDDPPLTDVIVRGNVVYNIGQPRYRYAVIIAGGPNTPRGLHFSDNLFHPGSQGVANTDLPP